MTNRRKIMYEHAILKWKYLSKNDDPSNETLIKNVPELKEYESFCSFCSKYSAHPLGCPNCPLDKIGENCFKDNSFWDKYIHQRNKNNAKKLLNLIRKLYRKELKEDVKHD